MNFAQTYYDTEDLATIRGANMAPLRILHLLGEILTQSPQVKRVDLSSSRITLRFPDGEDIERTAKNVRQWLAGGFAGLPALPARMSRDEHALLRAVCPHLSFVVCHVPETGSADDFNRLRDLARWVQRRSPTVRVQWRTGASLKFCQEDAQRPREAGVYSASTIARRRFGQYIKRTPDAWSVRGERVAIHRDDVLAQSFEEIVADWPGETIPRQLQGKLALVHIDGNGFSRIGAGASLDDLEARQSLLEQRLAERLRRAVAACRDHGEDNSKPSRVRLELIRWGGDDMVIALPAQAAWRVVAGFLNDVDLGDAAFGFSIAMVVAPHKTPIRSLLATAGSVVLERAKAAAKRADSSGRSAFAYMLNSSPDELPAVGSHTTDTQPQQVMSANDFAALGIIDPLLSRFISGKQRNELRTALRGSGEQSEANDRLVALREQLIACLPTALPAEVRAPLGIEEARRALGRFPQTVSHWIELRHLIRSAL